MGHLDHDSLDLSEGLCQCGSAHYPPPSRDEYDVLEWDALRLGQRQVLLPSEYIGKRIVDPRLDTIHPADCDLIEGGRKWEDRFNSCGPDCVKAPLGGEMKYVCPLGESPDCGSAQLSA
jgi:hypothetical protein